MLKRAADVLREGGIRGLWFSMLGKTVYRRVVLVERALDEPVPEVSALLPVVIDLLKESEVDAYVGFSLRGNSSETRRRLEAGQLCFVARHEGRLVCANWATTKAARISYLDCTIQLAPGEVYTYELFTSPDFRGQNIAPAVKAQQLRHFRRAGYSRSVAAIVPENRASLRADEKVGYRPYGVMGYVKLGPWRRDFFRLYESKDLRRSTTANDELRDTGA
jgi:RimJ/RimL family protein N-acetyltransferase